MDFLSLGDLIIKMRKEKGYSQRKFAQISGLSNTTISRIENGETLHPDIETLKLLAMHLNIDEADLVKAVNSPKDQEKPKRHSKLNYFKKPIRKIRRYSSVFSSVSQPCESNSEAVNMQAGHPQEIQKIREEKSIQKVSLKGMRLITLRLEKNITQKELADALGIDKTLISQFEGEIIKPDYDTVERLAEYFKVTIEYLSGISEAQVEYAKKESSFSYSKEVDLLPEYLAIAKEAQKSGIDPEDIRAFIATIKKYKRI